MTGVAITTPSWEILAVALLIFILRVSDVALGTWRLIVVAHGHKRLAAVLGFFEITIWVFAISSVMNNLGNIWLIMGYSTGFATGTVLGIYIEEKVALGSVMISVVSTAQGEAIGRRLRDHGFRVMQYEGASENDKLQILSAIAPRKRLSLTLREIQFIDPNAMLTVEDLRMAKVPTMPVR